MKTAITGASGRIGNLLVRRLLENGHEVRALVHRQSAGLEHLPVEIVRGDILDPSGLDRLTRDCEVIFHLAAVVSVGSAMTERLRRVNIEGTRRVLEAARRQNARRVVYFSTVHAFLEDGPELPFDETRPLALDTRMAYSRTKAEALRMALQFSDENSPEVVALCPTAVIGPDDPEPSLSGQMLIDFYRGNIPLLVPGGFDWVDVRDVAEGALAAMRRGRNGHAYLLGGNYATMSGIAAMIGDITGRPVPRRIAPYGLLRMAAPLAEAYSRMTGARPRFTRDALITLRRGSRFVSSEKARRELGYRSRPLRDTIADAYQWFAQHNYL